MKYGIWFLILLCLRATPVKADEECALGMQAIKPAMTVNEDLKQSHNITFDEQSRHLTEKLILTNGLKITYTVGGCTHYDYEYTFENIPKELFNGENGYDFAISLLKQIPGFESGTAQDLIHYLEKSRNIKMEKGFDEGAGFPCGETDCYLFAYNPDGSLKVGYNYPL